MAKSRRTREVDARRPICSFSLCLIMDSQVAASVVAPITPPFSIITVGPFFCDSQTTHEAHQPELPRPLPINIFKECVMWGNRLVAMSVCPTHLEAAPDPRDHALAVVGEVPSPTHARPHDGRHMPLLIGLAAARLDLALLLVLQGGLPLLADHLFLHLARHLTRGPHTNRAVLFR